VHLPRLPHDGARGPKHDLVAYKICYTVEQRRSDGKIVQEPLVYGTSFLPTCGCRSAVALQVEDYPATLPRREKSNRTEVTVAGEVEGEISGRHGER
jgi:hypothetical protein